MKEKDIRIRITEEEKEHIKGLSKKNGFDSVSAYILYLIRQQYNSK